MDKSQEGFSLSKEDLEKLLGECLKPEEISGDAAVQHARIKELICWFRRLVDGNANPKWFRSHSFELAYYIATSAGNRFIELEEVRKKAYYQGVNITPTERAFGEKHGFIPPITLPQPAGPIWVDKSRRQWMRKEAITIFELTKGYTPEQRALFDNAMKGMEDMAGHVLELTNEPDSVPQVFTREELEKQNQSLREQIAGLESNLAAYRRSEDTRDDDGRDWNT